MTLTCVLLAVQGAVGGIQYQLELPAEIVWIHVALAASLWLSLLWAAAAAGSVAPPDAAIDEGAVPAAPELVRS
jgi:cytochrome c oxidase assembly protein subunit 15